VMLNACVVILLLFEFKCLVNVSECMMCPRREKHNFWCWLFFNGSRRAPPTCSNSNLTCLSKLDTQCTSLAHVKGNTIDFYFKSFYIPMDMNIV
jgi:hypothetical protein